MLEFEVAGGRALFSDPVTRVGGQKCSYPVPTYEALKGIAKAIYWKPTFVWHIDAVRVMRPIQMYSRGVRPIHYQNSGNDLAYYTYLEDVCYQVRAHFEWNENRAEFACDRIASKHLDIASRWLERGGRRAPFLGASECPAVVRPCKFGDGDGVYDGAGEQDLGVMLHGLTYPDEAYSEGTRGCLTVRMWRPVMRNGVIEFIRPEDCLMTRFVRPMRMKSF